MDTFRAAAGEPDDRRMFEAITADIDIDAAAVEREHAEPQPAPTEAAGQASNSAHQPSPTPAPVQTPERPERPELIEPAQPERPDLDTAERIGQWASITGYVLSVAVSAFGQVMFFGEWLSGVLPAPGAWTAAAIGAAFAEVGMVGAGNGSLTKRRDGGRWRALLTVACLVCSGAATMQVAHWAPHGVGIALVFGLASVVGFVIHMVIEHSRLRDYEDRQADYAAELAAYRAVRQSRYEEDLAAYEKAIAAQHRSAESVGQPETRAATPPAKPAPSRQQPKRGKPKPDKRAVVAWSRDNGDPGPSAVRRHFVEQGYDAPSVKTVQRWLNEAA